MIEKKEILELIWHGKRYLCEEDCQCHTECPKATEFVNKIEPALSIGGVVGRSEQYHCELHDFGRKDKPCYKQCDGCKSMNLD